MTSTKFFFSLAAEDLKNRIWSVFLAIFVFFLILPVAFLLGYDRSGSVRYLTSQNAGIGNPFLPVVTAVGAVICALNGFSYLHSRNRVDYWHSLPVRREMLFAVKYMNGILIYLTAFAVNMGVTLALYASFGLLNADVMTEAYMCILVHTSAYWLFYSVALVTVFLTGHILVNLMGTGVFYLYGICVCLLGNSLKMTFFYSAYTGSDYFSVAGGPWASPINAYAHLISDPQSMFLLWIASVLFSALALLLYRLRPSEAAGRSMAFPQTEPLFKLLLIVPLSLAGGLFFHSLASRSGMYWFVFGLILFWFAGCIFVEVIYSFDFRRAFSHRSGSLICLAAAICILTILRMDLFGYDTYLPARDAIESMAISISDLDSGISTWEERPGDSSSFQYVSHSDYRLKHMSLTGEALDCAYAFADMGSAQYALRRTMGDDAYKQAHKEQPVFSFTVKFLLKNGREVYRNYRIPDAFSKDTSLNLETLSRIYASEEYKKGCFPLLSSEASGQLFRSLTFYDCFGTSQEVLLSPEQQEEFFQTFCRELLSLSFEDSAASPVCGTLLFHDLNGNFLHRYGDYPVYACYADTLNLLRQYGFSHTRLPEVDDITQIQVTEGRLQFGYGFAETAEDVYLPSAKLSYTDAGQIAKLLPSLISSSGNASFYFRYSGEPVYEVYLYCNFEQGNYPVSGLYYLTEEQMPEFLKKDLGLSPISALP